MGKRPKYSGGRVIDLVAFAESKGIRMPLQEDIVEEAARNIAARYTDVSKLKSEFDGLIFETEKETYRVYLSYEDKYEPAVMKAFVDSLVSSGELGSLEQAGSAVSQYFRVLDRFYLGMVNSRHSRAGNAFEKNLKSLFKQLSYPFSQQVVINGKPDFIMPSADYFKANPPDCIIFTAKRTIRERWRQVVTEGTHGAGFFLATLDDSVSDNTLRGMLSNRITLVVPEVTRAKSYADKNNVLSFNEFFQDHLDPAVERWKRKHVI